MSMSVKSEGNLAEAATLIFKATVMRTNASNEPSVASGPGRIVVRVDATLKASRNVGNLVGQAITIQLADKRPAMKRGDQAIFYATDWVFGKKVAVRELSHQTATAAAEKQVLETLAQLPLRHLTTRLRAAELVIVGVVEAIKPSPIPEPRSFNAPQWKVATVRIESALRSSKRGSQSGSDAVDVLFPSSDDWAPAPQFRKRQRGIFLLRHEPKVGIPPEFYAALDPADFQPRNALARVQSLLGRR